MSTHQTKVLIIGSGPAGYTAAIYAARANLEPIIVQGNQPGGQLTITTLVENYPGFEKPVDGNELMLQMQKQAESVGARTIYDTITGIDASKRPFVCTGETGDTYVADTVIVATGAQARWLGLESERKFLGYGVSGCATCDAVFFRDKVVAVVGGGNTAVEEALHLTKHASRVYLIHRRDTLRAEKVMQERLFNNPKIETIWNHVVHEVVGNEQPLDVTGVILENTITRERHTLPLKGLFVAIGHVPSTSIFRDILDMDEEGYLLCPNNSSATNIPGIFAAGDVRDKIYRQAITAAGQGCAAALDAEKFLTGL